MTSFLSNPYLLLLFTVQAVLVIRWIYRRQRAYDVMEQFVRDMAENHLDHIYDTEMTLIAGINKLLAAEGLEQIEPKLPPPIRFIDFNGKQDKK